MKTAATALVLALCVAFPAAAEDGRVLVLGPDGRPLREVVVGFVASTERPPRFDAGDEGDLVELEAGLLDVDARRPTADALPVLWGTGLAATAVLPGTRAVRVLAARPLEGRVRFGDGAPAGGRLVVAEPERTGRLVHEARTDAEGRFRLPHLAPGRWRVAVRRGDGRRQSLGTFRAGERTAEGVLVRGGSVRGRVLDGDAAMRQPFPAVVLGLRALPGGEAAPGTGPEFVTDEDGGFAVEDLPAGVWEVVVPSGSPVHLRRPPPRVEITSDVDSVMADFTAFRRVRVIGRITSPDGKPIAGARLRLLPAAGQTLPEDLVVPPAATSDAEGSYAFESVYPGLAYRVAARAEGRAPRVGPAFEVGRTSPVAAPGLELSRGWRLEARVFAAGGTPLGDVAVRGVPASSPELYAAAFGSFEARTGGDGIATLEGLPLDDVRVRAGGDGWLEVEGTATWPRSKDTVVWNAVLERAPSLAGRVVPEGEGPLPPVVVRARPTDGGEPREAEVDETGAFLFEGLPPTPVDLLVFRAGAQTVHPLALYPGARPGPDVDVRIPIPPLHRLAGRAFDLEPGGSAGEIRLEAPVRDPVRDEDRWQTVRRVVLPVGEADPRWDVEDLAPGAYAVRLVQGDLDSGPVPIWIQDGDVSGVEVFLPRGGAIAGTVLREEREPALGAVVTLERLRGDEDAPGGDRLPRAEACDTAGAFAFRDVAPGLWRVVAREDALAPDLQVVRVAEGESVVVRDLQVGRGGALEGRIYDSAGRALDGARLELEPVREGLETRTIRTVEDGTFRAEGLAAGPYRLRLRSEAGAFANLEALVAIEAGETTEVDLMPDGRADIEGTVRRRGRAVPGTALRLVALGDGADVPLRVLEAHTDAAGAFAWRDLPAGRYAIDVLDGVVRARRRILLQDMDRRVVDVEVYDGRIPGRVVTTGDRAITGAWVRALPVGRIEAEIAEAGVRTGPEGGFVLTGLPPGVYDLAVSAPGLPPGRYVGAVAEVGSAAEPVTIVVGRGGTLALTVVDEGDRGVPEARVWIETAEGRPLTVRPYAPAGSGRLRLVGIPEGRWWVRVEARGFGSPRRRPLDVREGARREIRIALPRPARVALTIRTAESDVLPPARVELLRQVETADDARALVPVPLDALTRRVVRGGRVVLEDLGPGAYVVRIDAGARFERLDVPIEIAEGERRDLRIALPFAVSGNDR